MPTTPVIEVHHLYKSYRVARKQPGWKGTLRHLFYREYRDIPAVSDISFTVREGEMVGFLGPNGAGKTTTLKVLTGLIYPTKGEVRVAGHVPFRREHAFLRKITLVMGQKQQLLWDLPVMDSLRVNAAVYDIPEDRFHKRVKILGEMLDILHLLTTPVRKLSLGERMKAELLAALLHDPEVLFLDEPTLGLDVTAQEAVRQFLRDYNRQFRATILLTSHYMADITALCSRVMVIHQGRLIYDGALRDLRERFSPYREIAVEFEHPVDLQEIQIFGDVEEKEGVRVRLLVNRDRLTTVVSQLLQRFPIRDFTVQDPPIEEVIRRVFQQDTFESPTG